MNKTYVIGDIHGCPKTLTELLKIMGPIQADDTILFIGDYIDRGPDSKGVIDIILGLYKKHRKIITLMGNHEFMFMNALKGISVSDFLSMGGDATLKSYGIPLDSLQEQDIKAIIPRDHLTFFQELLLYWEDQEHIFVHAGLQPGVHLTQQSMDWLLWARDEFIDLTYDFGKKVIYGHTPYDKPKIDENKIGIDTGVVYEGQLTCLVLPDMEFISLENKDE
jgi:serine/threonine protein phosphatase 1